MRLSVLLGLLGGCVFTVNCQRKILLTSDNGWAVAQVRAEYEAFTAATYNVILDAPADDASNGTVSPIVTIPLLGIKARVNPCQFNTCSPLLDLLGIPLGGFPISGINSTDSRINYITGLTADAVRDGIQRLSPAFFNSNPDLVIIGSHIGNTFGTAMQGSDGILAAAEVLKLGIPVIAFSGAAGAQVSYTTLQSDPSSQSSTAARIYASLIVTLVDQLTLAAPILPQGVGLSVNFPSIANCSAAASIKFVLSRITPDPNPNDDSCVNLHLPTESKVVGTGCLASISAFDASLTDVDPMIHVALMSKLLDILICPRLS